MLKAVAFDLDGTLYEGKHVVHGALAAVSALKEKGYRIFYLTNNSGKSQQDIVSALVAFGFPAKKWNTYSVSGCLPRYLIGKGIVKSVYLIGTHALAEELKSWGITIIKDASKASVVVVGIDPLFDYHKMTVALQAIDRGAQLIVANLDPSYPADRFTRLPGCGALVAAIVNASGHTPDACVGKPNTYMLELLCSENGLLPEEICVVGDVLESDIAMARTFGCPSVLFNRFIPYAHLEGMYARTMNEVVALITHYQRR